MPPKNLITLTATALLCCAATAQTYKCEVDGKTVYTDEKCLDAQKINTAPTQGVGGKSAVASSKPHEQAASAPAHARPRDSAPPRKTKPAHQM